MINYHKILEMHLQGISQRTISSSTGHSRDKIREVVNQAKAKGFEELSKEMNNPWLEANEKFESTTRFTLKTL